MVVELKNGVLLQYLLDRDPRKGPLGLVLMKQIEKLPALVFIIPTRERRFLGAMVHIGS
jgi:hypothetical protein